MEINYCSLCGAAAEYKIPENDERHRAVCTSCRTVHYQNPKVVVGCIPQWNESVLLCKRNIEPRFGKWTLPAGFLENGETVEEGAVREVKEETRALVDLIAPYRMFNIVFVNQMYLMFRSRLQNLDFGTTPESSELRLFREDEIPWDEIAFLAIKETLKHYFEDVKTGTFPFRIEKIQKPSE